MKLFDYIKTIFGSDVQWDKTKNYDKSKNSFMLNRFMSIKFPAQAQLFNMLRTDPVGQAEAWRMVTSKYKSFQEKNPEGMGARSTSIRFLFTNKRNWYT